MAKLVRTYSELKRERAALGKELISIPMHEKGEGDLHDGHVYLIGEAKKIDPSAAVTISIYEPTFMDNLFDESNGFTTSTTNIDYVMGWAEANGVDIVQFYDTAEITKMYRGIDIPSYLDRAQDIIVAEGYDEKSVYDLRFNIMMSLVAQEAHNWTPHKYRLFSKKDGWHSYNYAHYVRTYLHEDSRLVDALMEGDLPYSTTWKNLDWTADDRKKVENAAKLFRLSKLKSKRVENVDKIKFDDRPKKDRLKYIETIVYDDVKIAPDEIVIEHYITFSAKYPYGNMKIVDIRSR